MWELRVRTDFSAAHQLRNYQGKCEQMHGHNWGVEVYVLARELDPTGLGMDFKDIREAVRKVLENLDHSLINNCPPFREINPSAENIARHVYDELTRLLDGPTCRVNRVTIFETPDTSASYLGAGDA